MPTFIVHHGGKFFEWSTVVDAPTTEAMYRPEFEAYYRDRYGFEGFRVLGGRLERAIASGTSAHDRMSAEDLISGNRAGPDDNELPFNEVLKLVGIDG